MSDDSLGTVLETAVHTAMEQVLEERPDPQAETSFTDPRAAGAVYGRPDHVLDRLRSYVDEGQSIKAIRRDFGLHERVTDGEIVRAARNAPDLAARHRTYLARKEAALRAARQGVAVPRQAPPERRRKVFGGIEKLPTKAEYEARLAAEADQLRKEQDDQGI